MKIAPALFACLKKVIIGDLRKYVISQGADKTAKNTFEPLSSEVDKIRQNHKNL